MRKILLLGLLFFLVLAHGAVGQSRRLAGRVTDRTTGEGLPGATVLLKDTTLGVSTNGDGSFSLSTPTATGTLVFSSIGYVTVEVPLGTDDQLTVALAADTKQLNEVVVTAFGIERQTKSLTYSVQQVDGAAVTRANQPNVTNALQGKVAGVVVRQSSGLPGASSQIAIRGSRSFTGNNQPLYVVDGLPIESNPVNNTDFTRSVDTPDTSSRGPDLNPNDIESISVLKGGAASTLYGLRAANGVVVITTKHGRNGRKPTLTYSSDYDPVAKPLGNVQPTYEMGYTTSFTFKGLSLTAQVDMRRGGRAYGGNTRLAMFYGIDKMTEDRTSDFVFDGVRALADAGGNVTDYVQNDKPIKRD